MAWAMNEYLLGLELAKRALSWSDLGRLAELSKPTRARLRSGKPVSAGVLRRVDAVLRTTPVLPEVAGLLADGSVNENAFSGGEVLNAKEVKGNGAALGA
jgi:hypothetical protein